MLIVTDAGRRTYKPTEKNDCTVRAIAKIFNMSYKRAHSFCEGMGRRERKGYPLPYWLYQCWVNKQMVLGKKLEHRFYLAEMPRYTVREFIELKASKGTFMIQVDEHVFAVINGIIYDDKKWDWETAKVISYFKFI